MVASGPSGGVVFQQSRCCQGHQGDASPTNHEHRPHRDDNALKHIGKVLVVAEFTEQATRKGTKTATDNQAKWAKERAETTAKQATGAPVQGSPGMAGFDCVLVQWSLEEGQSAAQEHAKNVVNHVVVLHERANAKTAKAAAGFHNAEQQ